MNFMPFNCTFFHGIYTISVVTCAMPKSTNLRVSGSSNTVGSILSLYCDDGYRLQGEDELTCTSEGSWDRKIPENICQSKIVVFYLLNQEIFTDLGTVSFFNHGAKLYCLII